MKSKKLSWHRSALYDPSVMDERLFTPVQANAALPLVRQIVTDIVDRQTQLVGLVVAYQEQKRAPVPSQTVLNESRQQLAATTAERDACVAELVEIGVQLKDAATGLIDFPGELGGERVLLCWRLGEERVEFFHTETEGFDGRRPIRVAVHA